MMAAPLAEGWNGISWALQTAARPPDYHPGWLLGVACSSSTHCEAVGGYVDLIGEQPFHTTLAEGWNGTSWSLQTTPDPACTTCYHALNGVACPSSDSCEAVGSYGSLSPVESNGDVTLAENWNGMNWAYRSPPIRERTSGVIYPESSVETCPWRARQPNCVMVRALQPERRDAARRISGEAVVSPWRAGSDAPGPGSGLGPRRPLARISAEQGVHGAVVGDPLLVEARLLLGEAFVHRLAVHLGREEPVGPVALGGVGVAGAVGLAAAVVATGRRCPESDPADVGELPGEVPVVPLAGRQFRL